MVPVPLLIMDQLKIDWIKKLLDDGMTYDYIAKQEKISKRTISKIKKEGYQEIVVPEVKIVPKKKEIGTKSGTENVIKTVNRLQLPSTLKNVTLADTSILRAFYLMLSGKHHRASREDLIKKIIELLKKIN